MQADRKQFFYYSPILVARPMRMRSFPIQCHVHPGPCAKDFTSAGGIQTGIYIYGENLSKSPGIQKISRMLHSLGYLIIFLCIIRHIKKGSI